MEAAGFFADRGITTRPIRPFDFYKNRLIVPGNFCISGKERETGTKEAGMARKHTAEQIIRILRQVEVG